MLQINAQYLVPDFKVLAQEHIPCDMFIVSHPYNPVAEALEATFPLVPTTEITISNFCPYKFPAPKGFLTY